MLRESAVTSSSIAIADSFAKDNFHLMKYIEFEGTKWKITNVEVRYPRLNLTVGGIYNEN